MSNNISTNNNNSANGGQNKNTYKYRGGRNNKNNNGKGKKSSYSKPVVNDKKFTGRVTELEGHIFDCSTKRSVEKFTEVLQNIKIYVGNSGKYKHPDFVVHMIDHLEEPELDEPEDFPENGTRVQKKLWEKRCERYVEKEEALKEGKNKLYLLLWVSALM